MTGIGCFKAYDIRGRVPNELDPILARAVGAGFADMFDAQRIVIGRDVRPSGAELSGALSQGLRAMGAEVLDIGICGTEEIYHATALLEADGGIMVTASHNPPEYNGMKFVRQGAKPVSADTGLMDLARWVEKNPDAGNGTARGALREIDVRPQYIRHILSLVNTDAIRPMRVVVNAGNGCAGPVFDALSAHLPLSVTRLAHEPDGNFPNGVPNPLLIENRQWTSKAVRETGADLGIAWDGDFDRCFLFDETGRFVEGYYLVGLLAAAMLRDHPGSRVVHDPRLVWNTREVVQAHGGKAIMSRCGHAYIKQVMRDVDAIYGGEMSGHHYFRDMFYCDSGMVIWLLAMQIMSQTGKPLSELVADMETRFPITGEINRRVPDSAAVLEKVEACFSAVSSRVSHLDGLSMEFADWRFNLRASNTEPLLRLNVETRGDLALLSNARDALLTLIGGEPA